MRMVKLLDNLFRWMTIIAVLYLYSCNEEKKYPDGLNKRLNPIDNKVEEFYCYNNQFNGLYIQYEDSGEIKAMGTYINNKREGLWDTLITDGKLSQIYYSGDTMQCILSINITSNTTGSGHLILPCSVLLAGSLKAR